MIAYEWETTIEADVIRVDPRLNGKQVRVVVLVHEGQADAGDEAARARRCALDELLALPAVRMPGFTPGRRDELYDRA